MTSVRQRVHERLCDIFGERPWLVTSDVIQSAAGTVERLQLVRAGRCFAVAARAGTGELLGPEVWDHRVLGLPPASMQQSIRTADDAMQDLPDDVLAAIDAFDPDRTMRVLGDPFASGRDVAGRRFFGARHPSWQALEDKLIIDAVWDAAGVPRAPMEQVDATLDDGLAAHRRLDRGHGTVWAGDAEQGWHGGASLTLPVQGDNDARLAMAAIGPACRRMRVMPFLVGVPCSIHAMVLPDGIAVFRPAEMVTLIGPDGRFVYGRTATFWDPAPEGRNEMRSVARRVAEHLSETLSYRGVFTIDGVMTDHGFRPTELNPRLGAAGGVLYRGFPMPLVHAAAVEGEALGVTAAELEADLLEAADTTRGGSVGFFPSTPVADRVGHGLCWRDDAWADADGAPPDATLSAGRGPAGSLIRLTLDPERTPKGPPVALRLAALADWCDTHLGTELAPCRPTWQPPTTSPR